MDECVFIPLCSFLVILLPIIQKNPDTENSSHSQQLHVQNPTAAPLKTVFNSCTCCICPCQTCAVAGHMFSTGRHCSTFWPCGLISVQGMKSKNTHRSQLAQKIQNIQNSGWIWLDICNIRHLHHLGGTAEPQGQLLACLRWIESSSPAQVSLPGLPLCEGPLSTNQTRSVTWKRIFDASYSWNTTYMTVRFPKGYPSLRRSPFVRFGSCNITDRRQRRE